MNFPRSAEECGFLTVCNKYLIILKLVQFKGKNVLKHRKS